MIDRRSAWSDPEVQALLARFVPAADEVGFLQRADTPEARLFRGFCEEGHYGGRTKPTSTRQGIYAITPSGRLLASWNSRQVGYVKEQLTAALAAWERLSPAERYPASAVAAGARPEDRAPEGGLTLVAYSRDLPREGADADAGAAEGARDWRRLAWNLDHVWFTAAEARALAGGALPEAAARRFVRLHARDNVRGQTTAYPESAVEVAELVARVVSRDGERSVLELSGRGRAAETGRWRIGDRRDDEAEHSRSFDGTFFGRAEWDGARFTSFRLAWAGLRTGATQYNGRADDPGPAPMAVVFELAAPDDRVAPSLAFEYRR